MKELQKMITLMYDQGEYLPINKAKAFELYKKSVENGNIKAQFNLGLMYHKGEEGVLEQDIKKAVELYEKAASKGIIQAQFNLGVLYSNGSKDIAQDKEKAAKLFHMAAEQGDADAQFKLGSMHAKVMVFNKKRKAFEIYEIDAKQNNPKA